MYEIQRNATYLNSPRPAGWCIFHPISYFLLTTVISGRRSIVFVGRRVPISRHDRFLSTNLQNAVGICRLSSRRCLRLFSSCNINTTNQSPNVIRNARVSSK